MKLIILKQELEAMEEKLGKVKIDKARVETAVEKQKGELLDLNDSITKLTKENADLKKRAELKEDELIKLEGENHCLREENQELKNQLDQINNMVARVVRHDETQIVNNEPVDLNIVNDEAQLTAPVPIEMKAKPEDGEFPKGGDEKSEPECMVSKEKESDEVLENENEESDHDESVPENAEENLEEQLIQQTEEVALIAISDTSFNSLHHSCKRCDFKSNQKAEFLEHMEKVHESEIRDACDVKLSKSHADDVLK